MYLFEDIRTIHLEITSNCQASCPMCARNFQGGILNPFIKITEIRLETFKEWFSLDFIKQLDRLYMCGNLGDPIIAQDTLGIFEYLREINPKMHLSMNTNGSAKDKIFWERLAKLGVVVRFGIDGLEDTHALYRINTQWYKIMSNAKTFINSGGSAIWDMLVFEHNTHQIEECRTISKDMGFKNFYTKNTSRFKDDKLIVIDNKGKTSHILYPTSESKNIKILETTDIINCKSKQQNSLYVSATGNVSPCCWLDNEWFNPNHNNRIDYMDKIGYYPNLNKSTFEEIFSNNHFSKISETWKKDPLKECSRQCGKVDRFNEQFK